jgi:hypothetical protein
MITEVEIEGNRFDIDQQAKEHAYNNAQPEIIKREILMTRNGWTIDTWDKHKGTLYSSKVWNHGRCIRFEGTQEEFYVLHDKLIQDESNGKVIGIYNEWTEDQPEPIKKANVYRITVMRSQVGLADFAIQKPFDPEPTRQDVLKYLQDGAWGYDNASHDFDYQLI